nr:DUF411 domain-containing protein [Ardenticatena sp.]
MKRYVPLLILLIIVLAACSANSSTNTDNVEKRNKQVDAPVMVVYKSPTCGCCEAWVEAMQAHGYDVEVKNVNDLQGVKAHYKVPYEVQACHTAVIGGYVVEGHVPPEQVDALLAERPDGIVGIATPGMPIGSVGMETPGQSPQPYSVVSFDETGVLNVLATYP